MNDFSCLYTALERPMYNSVANMPCKPIAEHWTVQLLMMNLCNAYMKTLLITKFQFLMKVYIYVCTLLNYLNTQKFQTIH